jgi:hypothetical protein
VTSSLHQPLRGVVGASFCKRLTSQAENVPRSIDIPVMNRSAILASPVSYFETLEAFRPPDASQTEQV